MDQQLSERLKALLDARSSAHPDASRIRIHRAISWLRRAEAEVDDADACFIFLWVSLNAAYASDFGFEDSVREQLRRFIAALVGVDAARRLHACLFERFSGSVRTLIDNRYVLEPFWRALREHDASGQWQRRFEADKQRALRAVLSNDTAAVLEVVFDRLYVLRNQLVHGGATWNSRVNRGQVRDGASLLGALLPIVIELMIEHPEVDFGEIAYPVVRAGA